MLAFDTVLSDWRSQHYSKCLSVLPIRSNVLFSNCLSSPSNETIRYLEWKETNYFFGKAFHQFTLVAFSTNALSLIYVYL